MLMTIEKWMSLLELSIAAEKFELSWKSKALIQLLDRQLSKSQKNTAYHYVMLLVVQIKRWNKFHSLLSYSMKLKFSKRKEKYNRTRYTSSQFDIFVRPHEKCTMHIWYLKIHVLQNQDEGLKLKNSQIKNANFIWYFFFHLETLYFLSFQKAVWANKICTFLYLSAMAGIAKN